MGNARTWAKWTKWTGVVPGHLSTLAPNGEQAGPFFPPLATVKPCKEWLYGRAIRSVAVKRDSPVYIPVYILGRRDIRLIGDDRESPSYELIRLLRERGADVSYCDPHFPVARPGRRNHPEMRSVPLTAEEFARYDLVLLSTAHQEFRNPALYRDTKLVVDTRNVVREEWGPKVIKA
jgi:UDP-N-acetyl-D-mannosaminuronate dehydrogenase